MYRSLYYTDSRISGIEADESTYVVDIPQTLFAPTTGVIILELEKKDGSTVSRTVMLNEVLQAVTSEGNRIDVTRYVIESTWTDSFDIVKTISGSVSGNDLTISVNGVSSDPIALPSGGGGTESGPTFTVLSGTDTRPNNLAKFAEWVANAKVGDNIKILGTLGSTGQFINTFDMSVVARDDEAKSLSLVGNGTAEILGVAVGHTGNWIPITTMRVDFTDSSEPMFRGAVCYDTTVNDVVDVTVPFVFVGTDTYMLLTSY